MSRIRLTEIPELTLAPGINARIVSADTMTVAHVRLAAGATLPEHHHEHEQVVNVIDGELELIVAGRSHILMRGEIYILASNVPHAANARTYCYVIDVFHPVREDFRVASFSGYPGKN